MIQQHHRIWTALAATLALCASAASPSFASVGLIPPAPASHQSQASTTCARRSVAVPAMGPPRQRLRTGRRFPTIRDRARLRPSAESTFLPDIRPPFVSRLTAAAWMGATPRLGPEPRSRFCWPSLADCTRPPAAAVDPREPHASAAG